MKKLFIPISITLGLLLCTGCAEDEFSMFGTISGTVTSSDTEEPVSGVKVTITPGGGSKVTSNDGTFQFEELDAEEYTLTFVHSDYNSQTKNVSVKAGVTTTLQVALDPIVPTLAASVESLDFGSAETTLAFDITNSGKGSLEWTISENLDWLSCSPSSGTTTIETSTVVVTVSRGDLERGNYSGSIVISSNGGSLTIPVTMSVDGVNLSVSPSELDFGSLSTSIQITLTNTGNGTLAYTASSANSWLVLSKESGSVTTTDYLNAIVSRDGLSAGNYTSSITFSTDGGDVSVPVKMEVAVDETPTVTVEGVSDITYNSAVLSGTIVSVGSVKVTRYGFCWGEQAEPTVNDNFSNLGDCSSPQTFEGIISNLSAETKYYFRAYAENSVGFVYSDKVLSFTTTGLPTLPEVVSGTVTEITSSTATANGTITSLGNVSKVSAYGHVWSTSENPTIETGQYTDLGGVSETVSYTSNLKGLDTYTTYHVRAYVTNEKGTAYGDDVSFTTLKADVQLTTSEATDIVHNAATCGGTIIDKGGYTIASRGVCWNTSKSPTVSDSYVNSTSDEDTYTCRMTDLSRLTTYYVRAFAKTSEGNVFYGDEKQFATTEEVSLPTLGSVTITNIKTTGATLISTVESNGNSTVTECGFCYSTSSTPTVDNGTTITCSTSSAELGASVSGLSEGTRYYVRSYAKNAMGTAYSETADFTTLAVTTPTLSSVTVSGVGKTTAKVSATVSDTGNDTVTECGFCWAESPYPTIYDNKVSCDVGTSLSAKLTGLTPLTTIYVRAYAVNAKGTGYSDDANFTTTDTDVDIWDGSSVATAFGGGLGSSGDPVIINAADQLKFLANKVNSGTSYSGVYFQLDVNIDLAGYSWTAIGTSSNPFAGSFNGNGNTVSGINVNTTSSYQGLFGNNSGTIKNLTVDGSVYGADYTGGIAGYNTGSIISCTNKAAVSSRGSYVGGVAGCNYGSTATISGSGNQGSVSGVNYVGGICGYYELTLASGGDVTIYNCENRGSVSATTTAGGILGYANLKNSTSGKTSATVRAKVNNCYNTATVSGSDAGGIVGDVLLSGGSYSGYGHYVYLDLYTCCNNGSTKGSTCGGLAAGITYQYTNSTESVSGVLFSSSYWLFDAVNDLGLENAVGSGTRYSSSKASWYSHNSSGCYYENSDDIVTLLNNWVTANYADIVYKNWTYETIDGFPCPVFDE